MLRFRLSSIQRADSARNSGRALRLQLSAHPRPHRNRNNDHAPLNHPSRHQSVPPCSEACSRPKHRRAIEIPYPVDHRVRREPQRLTSNDPIETARQSRLGKITPLHAGSSDRKLTFPDTYPGIGPEMSMSTLPCSQQPSHGRLSGKAAIPPIDETRLVRSLRRRPQPESPR